jgi:anaphase-promoting complex subunit 11
MKVKIKHWRGVSTWKWEIENEDVCGICRMPYEACCPGVTISTPTSTHTRRSLQC